MPRVRTSRRRTTQQQEEEEVSTPVVSRKESMSSTTTRRRRRRTSQRSSTASTTTTDSSDCESDQSTQLFTPRNHSRSTKFSNTVSSSLNHIDKQKLELIIHQYDDEVETRCVTLKTMGEQCCARVQRELAVQLFKLPTKLKQMTMKEFKNVYGSDIDNLCRMDGEAAGQEITSRILQTLHSNNNTSKTPRKTTNSSRLPGTGGKRTIFGSATKKPTRSTEEPQIAASMFNLQSAIQNIANPKDQLLQAQLLKQQLEAMMADLQRNL